MTHQETQFAQYAQLIGFSIDELQAQILKYNQDNNTNYTIVDVADLFAQDRHDEIYNVLELETQPVGPTPIVTPKNINYKWWFIGGGILLLFIILFLFLYLNRR